MQWMVRGAHLFLQDPDECTNDELDGCSADGTEFSTAPPTLEPKRKATCPRPSDALLLLLVSSAIFQELSHFWLSIRILPTDLPPRRLYS